MTTYTVIDHNGTPMARGLTVAEAAHEILSTDSRDWEIRPMAGGGWQIWTRQQVANRPWTSTLIMSAAATAAEAGTEMFADVLRRDWPGHYTAMTDADYDLMLADAEAE